MTHDELREVVARAMMKDAHDGADVWARDDGLRQAWLSSATAAIAAVRAALGEPDAGMIGAAVLLIAAIAASPLADPAARDDGMEGA